MNVPLLAAIATYWMIGTAAAENAVERGGYLVTTIMACGKTQRLKGHPAKARIGCVFGVRMHLSQRTSTRNGLSIRV